ncbi:unnamed protein product [Psylliodes chrysocephalus]|uniref:Uncharacterized protein n=1 Tax=Psylliodes chrysocephalus TaxID=3402493 RepID=A0A9P0CZ95_9CUCU|nr:unnamed protein product [Psylliodes chrysocephala]
MSVHQIMANNRTRKIINLTQGIVSEPLNILIPNSRFDSDIESDEEIMLSSAPIAYPVTDNLFDEPYEETIIKTVQAAYEMAESDDEEVKIRDNEALKLQATDY